MTEEVKVFEKFRNYFLGSELYTYIWCNGYQIIDQKIIQELIGLIRRYEKGPSYTTKKIDSYLKANNPEDLETNTSISTKTIDSFLESYNKNKPKEVKINES